MGYLNFARWFARCSTCKNRSVCHIKDAMYNQRIQATCYREDAK